MEDAEMMAKESELRREQLEAAAKACMASSDRPNDSELERREKNHHILERADMLKDESLPEVKQLNQLITEAKCQAIRDVQIMEKQKRL